MQLRGIDFGTVHCASGARGFFGEGYRHHRWPIIGAKFRKSTLVTKTTTLNKRVGNMPLKADFTPRELVPKCIYVGLRGLWYGYVLNAVGLSGPGAKALFEDGRWQEIQDPFILSFMSVETTPEARLAELEQFVHVAEPYMGALRGRVGLQINLSCPNVGVNSPDLVEEAEKSLTIASALGIPLIPKFSVTTSPRDVAYISGHKFCDAVCISNTVPWRQLPDKIPWDKLFGGRQESPLAHLAKTGGGLSGAPLFPLLMKWLAEARSVGLEKPINAGGGIMSVRNAWQVLDIAESIFIGSVAIVRPWRVKGIENLQCRRNTRQPGQSEQSERPNLGLVAHG